MALISTRNILLPFTNKLHLTTGILIIMAFTIFRLSGGEIEIIKNVQERGIGHIIGNSLEEIREEHLEPVSGFETTPEEATEKEAHTLEDIEELFQ